MPYYHANQAKRILKELRDADYLCAYSDCSFFIQSLPVDPYTTASPATLRAVIVSAQTHAIPIVLQMEFGQRYPYEPPAVQFISRVPHPLIRDDGTIDLDILGDRWSPAITVHTLILSLQSVLHRPDGEDVLIPGCIANPDWESGTITTEQRNIPELFATLLEAAWPQETGLPRSWHRWRFIRSLQSLLSSNPWAYKTGPAARTNWYTFLDLLALSVTQHRGYHVPEDPSTMDYAKQQWISEARSLLDEHFRHDGLRMILCTQPSSIPGAIGSMLRERPRVWSLIQSFITDIEISELFRSNPFLMELAQTNVQSRQP